MPQWTTSAASLRISQQVIRVYANGNADRYANGHGDADRCANGDGDSDRNRRSDRHWE
ncbi:MAG: hypothetical protein ACLQU2_33180 [Candidatus Binataceae bacterium]